MPWTGAVSIFIIRLKEITCRSPTEKHGTGLPSLTNAPPLLLIPAATDPPEVWEKT